MKYVICKECGKKINKSESVIIKIGNKNYSFCNYEEKNNFINKKEIDLIKKNCYAIIFNIFKKPIPIVYKKLKDMSDNYNWSEIYDALNKVSDSIEKYKNEKYKTDFALARYIEVCINNTYNKITEKAHENKFYIVNSKTLATVINYITGEKFYEFDDKFNEGKKCYSFIENDNFKNGLMKIKELRDSFKNRI
ncbi:hypothetical protein [Clostridium sp. VAP52]|uniref:hypothetical protein n=1 Tax=Clostridium sp. VAP52 TaxID=2949977 RepID=UPI00207AEC29|nr:hypothetical protein [Clostridium sp. VAP52]